MSGLRGGWHRPMIRNGREVRLFAALRPLLLEDAAAIASALAGFQGCHWVLQNWHYTPGRYRTPMMSRTSLSGIVRDTFCLTLVDRHRRGIGDLSRPSLDLYSLDGCFLLPVLYRHTAL